MGAHVAESADSIALGRAQAVSNSLPAHFLVHARALAGILLRPLLAQRNPRTRPDDHMLEARPECSSAFAVFGVVAGQCARGSPPYGLRSGDLGARVPAAGRLVGCSAVYTGDPLVGNAALFGVHAPAAGTFHAVDARPTFRCCDAGSVIRDRANISRSHCRSPIKHYGWPNRNASASGNRRAQADS